MCELVLVRHGETVGQSSVRLYGATDVALSDLGRRQMARVRDALASERFDAVIASPLCRSRESAEIVSGRAPVVVPGFREVSFGRWEGWTLAEVAQRDPDGDKERALGRDDYRYPDGESRLELRQRIARAAVEHLDPPPRSALAVLHKGVIKTLIATLTGLPYAEARDLPCELGSIQRLRHEGGTWRLLVVGDTTHLGTDRLVGS